MFPASFPVFSCVLGVNSLIINTIHFSDSLRIKLWLLKGLCAFDGVFLWWGIGAMVVLMLGEIIS